jgi:hypothetical protein
MKKDQLSGAGPGSLPALIAIAFISVVIATLAVIALYLLKDEKDNSSTIVAVATAALGVISTMVSGYFGVKVGTDSAKGTADHVLAASGKAVADAHKRASLREDAILSHVPADARDAAKTAADKAAI